MTDIYEQLGIHPNKEEVESPLPLRFSKGGKLTYNEWVYDKEKGEGQYIPQDITNNLLWLHKRGLPVSLDADVTLNDVFEFIALEPEICDAVFENCYIKEYVNYWKKIDQSKVVRDHQYDPDEIEFLEVYWVPDLFTYAGKTKISGLSRASFHGQGFILQEDKYEDEEKKYKLYSKDTRINWGIDFSTLETILDLPIKLNSEFKIMENFTALRNSDGTYKSYSELGTLLDCFRDFSFHEFIEAVMWELSFYGIEEDKITNAAEIITMKDSIDLDSLNK